MALASCGLQCPRAPQPLLAACPLASPARWLLLPLPDRGPRGGRMVPADSPSPSCRLALGGAGAVAVAALWCGSAISVVGEPSLGLFLENTGR